MWYFASHSDSECVSHNLNEKKQMFLKGRKSIFMATQLFALISNLYGSLATAVDDRCYFNTKYMAQYELKKN